MVAVVDVISWLLTLSLSLSLCVACLCVYVRGGHQSGMLEKIGMFHIAKESQENKKTLLM